MPGKRKAGGQGQKEVKQSTKCGIEYGVAITDPQFFVL
ncbi:hypothetical protein SDC9_188845 [bioreactor metagenome]|uniref:Uncharacterized protein n=1 Tax=bioreactor metagenome TaxID=1076179 RepID=A0A645HS38_9ZZZZ